MEKVLYHTLKTLFAVYSAKFCRYTDISFEGSVYIFSSYILSTCHITYNMQELHLVVFRTGVLAFISHYTNHYVNHGFEYAGHTMPPNWRSLPSRQLI